MTESIFEYHLNFLAHKEEVKEKHAKDPVIRRKKRENHMERL